MAIKVFFVVLVLCTGAIVAVILAIHFRVKEHLRPDTAPPASSDSQLVGVEQSGGEAQSGHNNSNAAGENRPMKSS
ncbi:MAG: hypothetical protein WB555_25710 [Candidatus Korobacteraceae bacterium]